MKKRAWLEKNWAQKFVWWWWGREGERSLKVLSEGIILILWSCKRQTDSTLPVCWVCPGVHGVFFFLRTVVLQRQSLHCDSNSYFKSFFLSIYTTSCWNERQSRGHWEVLCSILESISFGVREATFICFSILKHFIQCPTLKRR